MALQTGAIDFTDLNTKITTLIYENTEQDVSGLEVQETLVEIVKACAPLGLKVHNNINTSDIGKAIGFPSDNSGLINLYQRTPATAGVNSKLYIEWSAKTPNYKGSEGVVTVEFARQPNHTEIMTSNISPRNTVAVKFVEHLAGQKGKYKIESTTMPTYPNGAAYDIDFTGLDNFIDNVETFDFPIVLKAGNVGSNTFLAKSAPSGAFQFLLGADLKESLDNLEAKISAHLATLLAGVEQSWVFERISDYVFRFTNKHWLTYTAHAALPTEYNGLAGSFTRSVTGQNPTVTQIETGITGNLLANYINYGSSDNFFFVVTIADTTTHYEILTNNLLNDYYTSLGIGLGYGGFSIPNDILDFNKILATTIDDNGASLYNVTANGYGDAEAWFIIEEKAIQAASTNNNVMVFSSNYGGFTGGWFDMTEINQPQTATADTLNLVHVEIGIDESATVLNAATKMQAYEDANGEHANWTQVGGQPTKLRSTSIGGNGSSMWKIVNNDGFLVGGDDEEFFYTGYVSDQTTAQPLTIGNGQSANVNISMAWLDWDNMPATKEIEAQQFITMVNTTSYPSGFSAAIDPDNAARVILTTNVPRLPQNEPYIQQNGNLLSINTGIAVAGSIAMPELSNTPVLGIIAGVVKRGGETFVVMTSSKVKKVKLKPHNAITQGGENNYSMILVGGNDGLMRTIDFNNNELAGFVGLCLDTVADVNTITEVNILEVNPYLFLV